MPVSPVSQAGPYAEAARQRGKVVYPLNIGQPDIETPPSMLEAVRNAEIRVLGYSPRRGHRKLPPKLAAYYQRAGMPR